MEARVRLHSDWTHSASGLKALARTKRSKRLDAKPGATDSTFLTALDQADGPTHMDLPGLRNHPLSGDLVGFWAVTVTRNRRIIFRFEEGHATDVDLVDYH